MPKPNKRWLLFSVVLTGATALAVTAIRHVFYPQGDFTIRYHDAAPFRAFFKAHDMRPLQAAAVQARFGEPNVYGADKMSLTGARTRANSTWVYRLEAGGSVFFMVTQGEISGAYAVAKAGQPMVVETLRPIPRELASVAR